MKQVLNMRTTFSVAFVSSLWVIGGCDGGAVKSSSSEAVSSSSEVALSSVSSAPLSSSAASSSVGPVHATCPGGVTIAMVTCQLSCLGV